MKHTTVDKQTFNTFHLFTFYVLANLVRLYLHRNEKGHGETKALFSHFRDDRYSLLTGLFKVLHEVWDVVVTI